MTKDVPSFKCEKVSSKQYGVVAGVDEVGRGALAGPLVAAAVVFDKYDKVSKELKEIRDSKILTANKRFILDSIIKAIAVEYSFGVVSSQEIDAYGIGAANVLVFQRALDGLKECNHALIDGRKFRGMKFSYQCLEKGESKSISIAAASIIAKVYRDNLMQEIHDHIYKYDFASNKGYGSNKHLEALEKYGLSKFHRKSFLFHLKNKKEQQVLFC